MLADFVLLYGIAALYITGAVAASVALMAGAITIAHEWKRRNDR